MHPDVSPLNDNFYHFHSDINKSFFLRRRTLSPTVNFSTRKKKKNMRGHKTFKQLVTRSPVGAPSGQPALRSDEERAENGPRPAPLFSYQEGAGHWRSRKCPQGDALRAVSATPNGGRTGPCSSRPEPLYLRVKRTAPGAAPNEPVTAASGERLLSAESLALFPNHLASPTNTRQHSVKSRVRLYLPASLLSFKKTTPDCFHLQSPVLRQLRAK